MRLRALPMKTETLGYEKSLGTGKLGHFLREREEEGGKRETKRIPFSSTPQPSPTHIPITKRWNKNNPKIIKVLTLTEMTSVVGRRGDL